MILTTSAVDPTCCQELTLADGRLINGSTKPEIAERPEKRLHRMSKPSVLALLHACAEDPSVLDHYSSLSLPELLLHARSAGYGFTREELSGVIGSMEVQVIMQRDGEDINASSSLWRKMWGKRRLHYIVDDLYRTFSQDELDQLTH